MSELDPATVELVSWAKRAMLAAGRDRLTVPDLLCGLAATIEADAIQRAVSETLSLPDRDAEVSWPSDVQAMVERARETSRTDKAFPYDPEVRDIVHRAFAVDADLGVHALVGRLLASRHPLVREFRDKNVARVHAAGETLIDAMQRVYDRSRVLEERLNGRVLGQREAVRMLVDAYARSALGFAPAGPRGVFTLLGPSGVGKTLLAETFARELASSSEDGVAYRRFDMSTLAGHQNFEGLFGASRFYSGARRGELTGFVADNPRGVVLFDEIEKAHRNTVLSLMSILDSGEVVDRYTEEVVSFRETWMLFTTNLGSEVLGEDNVLGVAAQQRHSQAVAFDILASSARGSGDGEPLLPPEFVSRLAKGGGVVLSRLRFGDLLLLVDQTLDRQLDVARERSGLPLPGVTFEGDEERVLFLLTLFPDLDARRVVSQTESWCMTMVQESYQDCAMQIAADGCETFDIVVACAEGARRYLDDLRDAVSVETLLVDEHDHVTPQIGAACAEVGGDVSHARDLEETRRTLKRTRPDLVLLDLSINAAASASDIEAGLEILSEIRAAVPDVPVLLFSENPERRSDFDAVVRRVLRNGGARGFYPCRSDPANALAMEDFVGSVTASVRDTRFEKLLESQRRAHKAIRVERQSHWDHERQQLRVVFERVEDGVLFSAADQASPIRFSGVPSETFESVIGLERPKKRLSQAVGYLQDPAALRAFDLRPPRGLLFAGPPGTGKTMMARAVAGEAGLPFIALSAGDLLSKWLGESERLIRELFARARRYAPSIVFIDEIDGIARSRSTSDPAHYALILNQLLACMDGFDAMSRPVLVLAATNRPETLDPAIVRPGRFDETILFHLPNAGAREAFLAQRLRRVPHEPDVSIPDLVAGTAGCSPAELDRIVREAGYAAAAAGRERIEAADLDAARRLVRFGAERTDLVRKDEDRKATAWHESGHAVVFGRLFPARSIDYVTIVPNDQGALGFLAPRGDDDEGHNLTRGEVGASLAVALAGRGAELLLGKSLDAVSSGASQDLERATRLAWTAVARWGLDPEIGPVSLDALPQDSASALRARATERVRDWLMQAESTAADVLQTELDTVARLAEALVREESLEHDEIAAILSDGSGRQPNA